MKYLSKHKVIVIFLESLFIIGIIIGIILGIKQSSSFKENIILSMQDIKKILLNNHINNILPHILMLIFIFLSTLVVPLFFLNYLYILYKGISFGFLIFILSISFGIKGFISAFIYFIITNIVYLSILLFILIKGSILSRNVISYFIDKNHNTFVYIKKESFTILIFSIIIILNDIGMYFLSNNIINKIFFMF